MNRRYPQPDKGSHPDPAAANLSAVADDLTNESLTAGKPGWWARHTSVATRLAIGILVVSVTALLGTVVIAIAGAGADGEDLLHLRLATMGVDRADELNSYIRQVRAEFEAMGSSDMLIDGVQEFDSAYQKLAAIDPDDLESARTDLAAFYFDDYLPVLEEVRGEPVDLLEVAGGLRPAALYLQSEYLAGTDLAMDEKKLLTDASDGSEWTEVHKKLHPTLRAATDRLRLADFYLIEPDARSIVYSTNKAIDFGTSLDSGPHSGTTLARLVTQTIASGEPGLVFGSDFATYAPGFDQPTAFAATPLYDDGSLVGVVAGSLSNDVINDIMSLDRRNGQLGETGDAYLVGSDGRMRSDARLFTEDPEAYLARVAELGAATAEEQNQMRALNTTMLFQNVDSTAVRAALQGESGVITDTRYLGDTAYTAYQPLDLENLDWVLIVEANEVEVDAPLTDYVQGNLFLATTLVVALTFFAVAWSSSFVNPLRAISAALARIRDGSDEVAVPRSGASEFRVLSDHLNTMVSNLSGRKQALADAVERKTGVLAALLPPGITAATAQGDRRLVESVPHASVVVCVFDGLDEVFQTRDTAENRNLMRTLVAAADEIAGINGVERVKVMGTTYYAVCGIETPYLDHAPRAVRFAHQARDAVRRIAAEHELDLDLSAGVQSGSLTMGLIGNARLIYDLWGDTAEEAYLLARTAGRGDVVVTDQVKDRLADAAGLDRFQSGDVSGWIAVPSGIESESTT